MKYWKGILTGLVTGLVVGLVMYYRSVRLREEQVVLRRYPGHPPAGDQAAEPPAQKAASRKKDRLEVIRGIGPVYARRLQHGGVRTFADLAALTPDQVQEILGPTRLPVDPAAWIAEARKLSG